MGMWAGGGGPARGYRDEPRGGPARAVDREGAAVEAWRAGLWRADPGMPARRRPLRDSEIDAMIAAIDAVRSGRLPAPGPRRVLHRWTACPFPGEPERLPAL